MDIQGDPIQRMQRAEWFFIMAARGFPSQQQQQQQAIVMEGGAGCSIVRCR